ncbi:pilus assembly protein FimV [Shewanella morhuae]|uniref:FimV/HubP family polar landmark protein n=1 Tax=Shewanella morhuae TaxID=365591 RepID=UPI000955BFAC|nr:FimV/HubP family polar landmark protein [Shewanella morhuae]SIQ86560.1 pilus assembly protein FimV [Shewanella morhuae]
MTFRTSYLVGLVATILAVSSITYFVDPAIAADTPRLKPLKIMGPDGQIRQVNHQYGPTTSKDTFWSIAQKVRPDASVSIYQVMAALYDANPHAFNSASYNSLERGMILLVPSKDVMQSIPNRIAIARAEQSDKPSRSAAKNTAKPTPKVTTKVPVIAPAVASTVLAEKASTPPAPAVEAPAVAPIDTAVASVPAADKATTSAAVTNTQTQSTPEMVSSDITTRLEAAESKNLSLTDELARTQDQLSVRTADVEALKVKVEELNQRIAVLEETLQASKLQNQALKTEIEATQISEPITTEADTDTAAEPDDLWRNFLNNPMLMVAAAVIPALFLLLGVFWLLRRKRNKERREMQAQQAAMAAGATATTLSMDNDDLGDMAVHLDRDPIDSIDSLLDMGSVDLQPEHDLSDASDQMDMASEMFIDQSVAIGSDVEEEGQSLDDLWAEAMGDQEEGIPESKPKSDNIIEEADLDALLAGLDFEETSNENDNFSELERNFGNDLAQTNDVGFEKNNAVEIDAAEPAKASTADTDDLDALLAEFSAPVAKTTPESVAADDLSDALSDSSVESVELDDAITDSNDDIAALLAGFDKPTPAPESESAVTEPDLSAEIADELDAKLDDLDVDGLDVDDIDALLAGFDKPTPASESTAEVAEPDLSAEIAAELDAELDNLDIDNNDDIDALLADFDKPTPAPESGPEVTRPDLSAEIAAELDAELDDLDVDNSADIDALLAGFDKPAPASESTAAVADHSAEIAAELDAELDDLDVDNSADIDALLAGFDKPAPASESTAAVAESDLSAEIAAELDAELDDLDVGNSDDIDALLADFDKPTSVSGSEPEVAEPNISAEIAAELDADIDELGVDDTDDIDSLLASFETKPEVELDTTAEPQNDLQDSADSDINAAITAELQASLPEDLTNEEDLDALLAQFDLPEQSEADADEINFDIETAAIESTDTDDANDLLKGIGAGHDPNGTDDTFELDDEPQVSLTTAGVAAATAAVLSTKEKESSFFNDLKANKSADPHVLDWDSELDFAPKANPVTPQTSTATDGNNVEPNTDFIQAAQDKPIKATRNDLDFSEDVKLDTQEDVDELDFEQGFDLSDDNVLAAFTANADFDEDEDVLTSEDSFSLIDDHNLTVDEALAALDAQESRKAQQRFVPEHDLTHFQNENGFIDIDKLLNDANEEGDTDQYSEIDVEMSDVNALIGDAAMIDVDDEENSVNAKLDLARAYIEIDDSDSAKALLKEVNIDGNARQQEEAQRLLKNIS